MIIICTRGTHKSVQLSSRLPAEKRSNSSDGGHGFAMKWHLNRDLICVYVWRHNDARELRHNGITATSEVIFTCQPPVFTDYKLFSLSRWVSYSIVALHWYHTFYGRKMIDKTSIPLQGLRQNYHFTVAVTHVIWPLANGNMCKHKVALASTFRMKGTRSSKIFPCVVDKFPLAFC